MFVETFFKEKEDNYVDNSQNKLFKCVLNLQQQKTHDERVGQPYCVYMHSNKITQ